MLHDDRREAVKANQPQRYSRFSVEPIEPRMMLAFGGAMDIGALHFHVHEQAFAGFQAFSAPSHSAQLQGRQSAGAQLTRANPREQLEQAIVEALAEFAPVRSFGVAPRYVVIIFNPQMPAEPPAVMQNPPPIQQPSNPVNVARSPAPAGVAATAVTPPATSTAQAMNIRASSDMTELLNSAQTTAAVAARSAVRTAVTTSNLPSSLARGTWSIGAMLYPSLAPDEKLAPIASESEAQPAAPVQIASVGRMVVDAASSILQSPKKMMEIARMGSPLKFVGDSIANFIEESAAIPTAIIQTQSTQTAWIVTFTVLAADSMLLANYYRRMRRIRSLARAGASHLPMDCSSDGYQRPTF